MRPSTTVIYGVCCICFARSNSLHQENAFLRFAEIITCTGGTHSRQLCEGASLGNLFTTLYIFSATGKSSDKLQISQDCGCRGPSLFSAYERCPQLPYLSSRRRRKIVSAPASRLKPGPGGRSEGKSSERKI